MLVSEGFTKNEYLHKLPGDDLKRQKEVFGETIQKVSTCRVPMQIPFRVTTKSPLLKALID